jgi:hypothetical protein
VSAALLACTGGRSAPSSHAAASPEIEVPAPPAGRSAAGPDDYSPQDERSARAEPEKEEEAEEDDFELEISQDGGTIQVVSAGDSSVRVWGTFTRFDGGFSFQGGFNAGFTTGDGGP